MASILEALQNAQYNFQQMDKAPFIKQIALGQLHNAIVLLDKGYHPMDDVEEIMTNYEKVEHVPDKE